MIDKKLKLLEELPAFQRWYVVNSGTPAETVEESMRVYRSSYATFDQIVLYLELFNPEFVEVNGLVLREGRVPDDLEEVIARFEREGSPLSGIEYLYNHVHLHDFCLNDPDYNDIPQEVAISIAREIEQMWRRKLTDLFPKKEFVVGVGNEDAEVEVFAYVDRT